jgi:hypothetical protein
MADKPLAPHGESRAEPYTLPPKAYKDLCIVRDELRLFAAVAARRAARNPEMLVYRNTLAHCFDHLAQRVDDIVHLLDETSEKQAEGSRCQQTLSKH